MGYKVILSRQADRDLEQIVRFLAQKNPAAAERLGHALLDRAVALARPPNPGVAVKGRPGYYRILHQPWFAIYYRISENQHVVEVARIWDGRQDPKRFGLR